MTVHKTLVAAVAICLAAPGLAADEDVLPEAGDDISKYRNVGEWTVFQNATRGACFISRNNAEEGSLVQMGLTRDMKYGYIGIFMKDGQIEEGSEAVAVLVNDNLYVGEAENVAHGLSGGYKGGYILADNKQLRLDIEQSETMEVFPDLPFNVIINLDKTRNAIFEARKCTEKLQSS